MKLQAKGILKDKKDYLALNGWNQVEGEKDFIECQFCLRTLKVSIFKATSFENLLFSEEDEGTFDPQLSHFSHCHFAESSGLSA